MRERRQITVQGVVQGVGFRPFVYRLAQRWRLDGSVRNDTTGVVIDVEGEAAGLESFLQALVSEPPPLAHIEHVASHRRPLLHYSAFGIEPSRTYVDKDVFVAPDVATCERCLVELADVGDRRYGYAFLTCTNCGPRFTIMRDVPYDRQRTTMAGFRLCAACQAEYDDPRNRRFHAEATACPMCGPRLRVADRQGAEVPLEQPLSYVSNLLHAGAIVAIKGLGGYHLACDALQAEAVSELRRRKRRDAKPLAVMAVDINAVGALCHVTPAEEQLLSAPERPIVLLRKRHDGPIAAAVAPSTRNLGVMLPYTPLHHLLLRQFGRPLVMTSGNLSEEPIAAEDDDAMRRLAGVADAFLLHDRPIGIACDDSVLSVALDRVLPLRRSRGYAPRPVRLPAPCTVPILACGGHLKNTFCLARGEYAFLSHHMGDLDDFRTYRAYIESIAHYQKLFGIVPQAVAHDLHPAYLSTQYARSLAGLPHLAIQHHHAHIASCLAENGCVGPVIGVAWDGTGYGTDGHIWGGEFLVADYVRCERLAHLQEVPLPGGEQAIRQPWRMAAAYLHQVYGEAMADLDIDFVHRLDLRTWRVMRQMIARGVNSPLTSSAGRLFDAVAALVGVRHVAQYEGQAAVELEMLAEGRPRDEYICHIRQESTPMVVETAGVIAGVVDDLRQEQSAPRIAAKFHTTLSTLILTVCGHIRERTGLGGVALSGGVFQNVLLLTQVVGKLQAHGFEVYTHSQVPPNDGGIALGQVAVANAILAQGR
jgi:hydrogenase maturation protein HypF